MDKRLPWSVPTSRATAWYSPPSWLIWIWRNFNWTANVCQSIDLMESYWFPRFVFLQKSHHPWNPHHCLQLTFLSTDKVILCTLSSLSMLLHCWSIKTCFAFLNFQCQFPYNVIKFIVTYSYAVMTLNKYKNLSQYIFHIAVMVYVVSVSASVSLVAE